MVRFFPYILKSLWRQRSRSLLTISGAAVALFVFCFVGAVQEGLAQLMHDQESQRRLIVFQANRFCPYTSKLPEDYALAIRKLSGVRDAVPIMVFMNNCRASLDVVVFHGMPADKLKAVRQMEIVSGSWSEFEQRRDAALVGQALAHRRGLRIGQKFSIGDVTVTVAGIFTSANPRHENFLYTHLEFLQRTRGQNAIGTVTQLEVLLADGADANTVCRAIDRHYRGGPVATDTRPKHIFETHAIGDLIELIHFTSYLGYACVGLVLALVATTTVMAVQDRVREHALLQTLGYSSGRVAAFIVIESLILSLSGGQLGTGLALAVLIIGKIAVSAEGVTIPFVASPTLVLTAMGVTFVVGFIAGLVPAWQAARAEIVPALRQV